MKKYFTITAVIEIDDENNTINTFEDCLADYDNIGRPINRLEDVGWKVEFASLSDENPDGDLSMAVPGEECMDETIDNIKYLRVRAGVRYWEDTYVNGVEDDNDDPRMPFARESGNWYIDIDTKTGSIKDWPQGASARVHYKTCDDNTFYFINHNGTVIGEYDGYVPSCLAIDDDGWGDYIIFHIAANGKIEDWNFTQDDIDKIKQNAF